MTMTAMRTALVGALLFKGLGGSFRGLAPSDVCRPGAFFRWRVRRRSHFSLSVVGVVVVLYCGMKTLID